MNVINYFDSDRKAHWLEEIKKSGWSASAFLHKLLCDNTFFDVMGERSEVLLLTDGDDLISHCTFAERDDIQPTDLTPWVGFVYTFPKYRGHRYAGKLFDEVERIAKAQGVPAIYLSTNHIGLYEKYGFELFDNMDDIDGEPSRVYIKRIGERMLTTKRLILRRWEESDAEDLYQYAKDPDVGPIAGWKPHQSVEESREIIKKVLRGPEAYAVCLKTDGKAIGAIELMLGGSSVNELKSADECELGYWIAKPFWGQGLIPEAAREMLRRAFEDLGMSKVWCGYYDSNEKSKRVQEKVGFRYQYTKEEVYVPAFNENRTEHMSCITKEEWENNEIL